MYKYISTLLSFVIGVSCFSQFELIHFEGDLGTLEIDNNNPNNIWQIGVPQKTYFDSAYSVTNAIVTDTVNSYPINDSSSFIVGVDLYGSQPVLSFKHKFDTDTLHDGGYLEVSFDNGNSWTNLNNQVQGEYVQSAPYGMFVNDLYNVTDTLANGRSGLSGKSNGWITSEIYFECWAVKVDYMVLFRFTFFSDSTDSNHEGWMIDNIHFYNDGGCGNISEFDSFKISMELFPNPFTETTEVLIKDGIQIQNGTFLLFDQSGRKVITKSRLYGSNFIINREDLLNGVYFYRLTDDNGLYNSGKLVIN